MVYNFGAEKTQRTMHKELIRQLLLHLSLLNADFTIQGLLFSDFQIKAFKEKYLITNRVKNEDCKIQLRELRKFQVAIYVSNNRAGPVQVKTTLLL